VDIKVRIWFSGVFRPSELKTLVGTKAYECTPFDLFFIYMTGMEPTSFVKNRLMIGFLAAIHASSQVKTGPELETG